MTHHPFSPSQLGRIALCPGSYHLSQGIPRDDTPESLQGTRIHAALAGESVDLPPDDEDIVQRCRDYLAARKSAIDSPPHEEVAVQHEVPITVRAQDGNVLTSGTVDCLLTCQDRAVLIDWKTGFNEISQDGVTFQLSVYAVGVLQAYGSATVDAVAYLPRSRTEHFRSFDQTDIIPTLHAIEQVVHRAESEEILLRPGWDQCVAMYCPALHRCPAARRSVHYLLDKHHPVLPDLPIVQLCELADQAAIVDRYVGIVRDELRRRLEAGEVDPAGRWKIQTVQGRREVIDPQGAWAVCQRHGVSLPSFMSAVKLTLSRLEDEWIHARVMTETGQEKSKAQLKREFGAALSHVIQRRPSYTKLQRSGGHHDRDAQQPKAVTAGSASES